MNIITDSTQMKIWDSNTIHMLRVPSLVLMERAALAVVEEMDAHIRCIRSCLVVCGQGNNGGDGLAIARLLHQKEIKVTVWMDELNEHISQETRQQYEILMQYGVPVVRELPKHAVYDTVVDAAFGIGLSREITGVWRERLEVLNKMSGYKVAVDIPSGIHGTSGQVLGMGFQADLTVTFAYAKAGLLLHPGMEYAGETVVRNIGIDEYSWMGIQPYLYELEPDDLCMLPDRKQYSNKGSYGKVLVIASQKNMAGAGYFSAKAAAMTGCGLVKIFTMEENRTIFQHLFPEAILETYVSEKDMIHKLTAALDWADVAVLGPGLGTSAEAGTLVKQVLTDSKIPVIVDADALNLLAKEPMELSKCPCEIIITPHLGEMSRLTGQPISDIQEDLLGEAAKYAREHQVICVLKDARTITALPNGNEYINTSGCHGMATAGAGDVLTGILAGLIAQKVPVEKAAPLGVYLHGLAGEAAAREKGNYSMIASDLLDGICTVIKDWE